MNYTLAHHQVVIKIFWGGYCVVYSYPDHVKFSGKNLLQYHRPVCLVVVTY